MSQTPSAPNYVLIGHVTHDVLDDGTYAIGGTASYGTLTAAALGYSIGLLTSANSDFNVSALASVAKLVVKPARATTTFKNAYTGTIRHQMIYGVAQKLVPGDLPESWRSPLIGHIAPVFGECDYELLDSFDRGTYIGVTMQGWLREKQVDGRVIPKLWETRTDILHQASSVILSEDDIQGDWRFAEYLAQSTKQLVVTCGSHGGFIYEHNHRYSYKAPVVNEVNPTGAGDIFAAAFFSASAKGMDAQTAALFASCLAAESVTRKGMASIPTAEEIHQCSLAITEE